MFCFQNSNLKRACSAFYTSMKLCYTSTDQNKSSYLETNQRL